MKDRINTLIELEKLTAGQFADKVGINRPTLSHILNGRNKPGTEIITKIHIAFPSVSVEWLLFGEGEMYLSQNINPIQPSLFDENQINLNPCASDLEYCKEINSKQDQKSLLNTENKSVSNENSIIFKEVISFKKITKIMIFYEDNTFETFSSDSGTSSIK